MNKDILKVLREYKSGELSDEEIISILNKESYKDLGYAKVDYNRTERTGYPEVIFCEGKSINQLIGIVKNMKASGIKNILGTRASKEQYLALKDEVNDIIYYEEARILVINREDIELTKNKILIITGGTSDIPVAEEAAIVAELFGNTVERLYDVGVAGIHRLLNNIEKIRGANVIITVAGMEGALTSVVAGLVDKPVIAVPTSIGYGANFGGLAALLSMLNSCASGVSVVNIDNGFGAAYTASIINKMSKED